MSTRGGDKMELIRVMYGGRDVSTQLNRFTKTK